MGELLDIEDVDFVCDDATNRSPFNFSHIYMYDCIFSEDTYPSLLFPSSFLIIIIFFLI